MSDEVRAAMERVKQGPAEATLADFATLARAYLAEHDETVFTDDQCFWLNANQHRGDIHPYTCGNNSTHRPLIATRKGWRCADCDYTQNWAHGIKEPTESKEDA